MSNFPHDSNLPNSDTRQDASETPPNRELGYEYLGTVESMSAVETPAEKTPIPDKDATESHASDPVPQGKVSSGTSFLAILMFVLCFLLALYLVPTIAGQISYSLTRGSERAKAEVARELLAEFPDTGQLIPWVVKTASPSVVSVQAIGDVMKDDVPYKNVPIGEGSGFIADEGGYIVTNYHVIAGSNIYRVSLSDGRQTENVRRVGYDPITDLAVLKINLSDLTPISWGDSSSLEVGESVLAIGSPYSFANTVTYGIVSAKERYAQDYGASGRMQTQEYLQTDAAVNPGNSGGPLINMRGEVVGINTAIVGEAYLGICFSIPSDLAKRVYEEIREKGKVSYGLLGIEMSPQRVSEPDDEGNRSLGVKIQGVQPGLPAEKAGMKPGDVITNWNGIEIRDYVQLNHSILFTPPGTKVKVVCLRDKKPIEFEVTVAQRPVRRSR